MPDSLQTMPAVVASQAEHHWMKLNPAPSCIVDADGRVVACNQLFLQEMGGSQEQWRGRQLVPAGCALAQITGCHGQLQLIGLDGQPHISPACSVLRSEGGIRLSLGGLGNTGQYSEALLHATQRELEVIFNSAVVAIVFVRQRRILRCNRRMEELFGYGIGEMIGQPTRNWYQSTEEYEGIGAEAYDILRAGNYHRREQYFVRKDGSSFWGQIAGRALDPEAPQEGSVWLIEDRSEAKQAAHQQELAQRVFESSSEAILITDADNRIVSVNRACEEITGYCAAELIGQNPRLFQSGWHDPAFYQQFWQTLLEQNHWQGELWDRRKDGSVYPKLAHIDVLRDPGNGRIVNFVALFSDISRRKAKPINDRHGHHMGDVLLAAVAHRLRYLVRGSDLVARYGGDEFVVILEGNYGRPGITQIAEKLAIELAQPHFVAGHTLSVSASIGTALYPSDGRDAGSLIRTADSAMYAAKGRVR